MKKSLRLLAFLLAVIFTFLTTGCAMPFDEDDPYYLYDDSYDDIYDYSDESGYDLPLVTDDSSETVSETAPSEITEPASQESSLAPSQAASSEAVSSQAPSSQVSVPETKKPIDENGIYTTKEDVALYIHTYNKLPSNFITKSQAEKLGWTGGGLDRYAKNKCIGGGRFGNYEGILPKKKGRTYTECDIDTLGAKSRGAKRIVFSNDGLIYYTDDHYETFELLYGEE